LRGMLEYRLRLVELYRRYCERYDMGDV
jgi:hypothetical protein